MSVARCLMCNSSVGGFPLGQDLFLWVFDVGTTAGKGLVVFGRQVK